MPKQTAPAHVAATLAALPCFYNGEQPGIVRRGVVLFPPHALFTVDDPQSPAHQATFSVPAASLNPDSLQNAYNQNLARFANHQH